MKTTTILLLATISIACSCLMAELVCKRMDKLVLSYDDLAGGHARRRIMACEITIDRLEERVRTLEAKQKMMEAYLKYKMPATPEDVAMSRRMMDQWTPPGEFEPMRAKIVQDAHRNAERDQ